MEFAGYASRCMLTLTEYGHNNFLVHLIVTRDWQSVCVCVCVEKLLNVKLSLMKALALLPEM